jgi:ubiquinone/menaquinone biosynthesis C-methylase UbiE
VVDHPERKRAQQQLLDQYFTASRPWKDIHYREGLYETIYRQRWGAAVTLLEQMPLPPGSRVLEIGCGPGVTTLALVQRGYLVYAVDTVGPMIDSMRQLVNDAGLGHRVRGTLGDINDLPFSDNCFDAVVVVGVLEWLESWDQPLREIARVMRPLGLFVGVANNAWALHRVLDPRLSPLLQPVKRMIRALRRRLAPSQTLLVEHLHSAREVQTALNKAGWYTTTRTTVGFGPFSFLGLRLLKERIGLGVHRRLQRWADAGVPLLRSMGFVQIFLARKVQGAR